MKKLFFIAAFAGVALASCTKNEVTPAAEQQITFATPVVGTLTKAVTGEIGAAYDKNEKFIAYGWYSEAESFDPATASLYIDGTVVSHDPNINIDADAGTQGAWLPATTFYWPKNGKLTFSAYSPADAKNDAAAVNCDVTTGLRLGDFTVQATPAAQYDLLYSDRAYNKTTSVGEVNTTYDGVDLQFRHALSSIHVTVKNDMTYPEGTITINKIELQNVYNTATFSENLVTGTELNSSATAAWSGHKNLQTVVLGDYEQVVVYDKAKYGTTSILIPQVFDHGTTDGKVSLYVEYTIMNENGTTLKQRATFELDDYSGVYDDGTVDSLTPQWVKGYRYTYNLTFGLTKVYFAPSVTPWTNITVDLPQL